MKRNYPQVVLKPGRLCSLCFQGKVSSKAQRSVLLRSIHDSHWEMVVSSTLFKNRAETFKVPNYFSGDESLCGEEMKKRSSKMQNCPFPHRKLLFVWKRQKGALFLTTVDTTVRQDSAHLSEMCTAQKYQQRKMEKSSRMSGLKWQEHLLPCPLSLKFPEDSAMAPQHHSAYFFHLSSCILVRTFLP